MIDFRDIVGSGAYLGIFRRNRFTVSFIDVYAEQGKVPFDCVQSGWLQLLVDTGVSRRQVEEVVKTLQKRIYNFGATDIEKFLNSDSEHIINVSEW